MSDMYENIYNPDVLSCISNLSNDEVFTPPEVVNQMLDMLPDELWSNSSVTFLDPACKSGVFLREIAKRLIEGLKEEIPNLQKRIDHIFQKQLYGIAITELTSLLSRRSLYCSKYPNSKYSISQFDNASGNIRFKRIEHIWKNGKCIYCGASQKEYQRDAKLETHAYEWIHTLKPEEIFNMKFDVIIGNPPYQLSDGGAQASAKPIYNMFIHQAKKLNPRYITMIVPSRWMTGGKGLDSFRQEMITDKRMIELHDFADSKECFNGVDIKGGVCYFLWSKDYRGKCRCYRYDAEGLRKSIRNLCEDGDDIFIRDDRLVKIKNMVWCKAKESFSSIVSATKPYGLRAETMRNARKYGLPEFSDIPIEKGLNVLGLIEGNKRGWKYIENNYPLPKKTIIGKFKVFISEAYGCGEIGEVPSTPVLGTPVLGTPVDICTETFLQIGPFDEKVEAINCIKYIQTKFFRTLVGIKKQTQHTTQKVYTYVPLQNFKINSDINWNVSIEKIDQQLFEKYKLDNESIEFIKRVIKPMELGDESFASS